MKVSDIFEAIRCREEELDWLGRALVIRELDASSSLVEEQELDELRRGKEVPDDETYWRIFARSVTVKETGARLFEDEDIPKLRQASRFKLQPLTSAVARVNGLSGEDNAKNSSAVQA